MKMNQFLAVLLFFSPAVVFAQHDHHEEAADSAAALGATTQAMNQLQTQVSTLTDRLNEMTAKQSAATSQTSSDLRRAALRGCCREYHGSPGSYAGARRPSLLRRSALRPSGTHPPISVTHNCKRS